MGDWEVVLMKLLKRLFKGKKRAKTAPNQPPPRTWQQEIDFQYWRLHRDYQKRVEEYIRTTLSTGSGAKPP